MTTQSDTAKAHEAAPESRALVLADAPSPGRIAAPRPLAPFVTQLFACEAKLEAFRRHRRAGPGRASACYAGKPAEACPPVRFERVL